MAFHVGKERFAELVETVASELPEPFQSALDEVAIEIVDRPTRAQHQRMNLPDDQMLLGLYQGRPRTRRSIEDSGALPDVIYIFQHNIESICRDPASLAAQVRTTVLHEIGHHFGMSEEDLDKLGYG
jgi:predicted Zn-dependent protease with MMP-like domain